MNKITKIAGFYEALAHLFYAAAMADRSFVRNEKLKIIQVVESSWNTKIQHNQSKEIIYETLKKLIANKETSNNAFNVFEAFYVANKNAFAVTLKKDILKTVNSITNASILKSKGELILIARLYNLMHNTYALK